MSTPPTSPKDAVITVNREHYGQLIRASRALLADASLMIDELFPVSEQEAKMRRRRRELQSSINLREAIKRLPQDIPSGNEPL